MKVQRTITVGSGSLTIESGPVTGTSLFVDIPIDRGAGDERAMCWKDKD